MVLSRFFVHFQRAFYAHEYKNIRATAKLLFKTGVLTNHPSLAKRSTVTLLSQSNSNTNLTLPIRVRL